MIADEGGSERRSGPYFSYEATFFKFHFTHDDAFQVIDSLNDTVSTTSFGWNFQYAPRFEAGYVFEGCQAGVRARYFAMNGIATASDTDMGVDNRVEVVANSDPNIIVNTLNAGEVLQATHRVELDTFDIEWFAMESGKPGASFLWGAGLRHGQIQHEYEASNPDRVAGAAHAAVKNGFEGFGPVFFAEGSQQIGRSPFSFTAGGRGALLFGETNYAIESRNPDGSVRERVFENGFDTLPIIESQVGLRYDKQDFMGGHLSINAALEGQYWFKAGTGLITNKSTVTNGGGQNDERESGMGMIGGVLEVEYLFPEKFAVFNLAPGGQSFERSGPYVAWENTWLQPRFSRDDAFHRVYADGTGETVPFEWGFNQSPRIEVGYHFGESGQGVRARYWSWDGVAHQSQNADPNVTQVDVVASQVPFIRSRSTEVDTSHAMELETFDLDFFSQSPLAGPGQLKIGGGLRYASVDHRYLAVNDTSVFPPGFDSRPVIENGFKGMGPTVFAEGDYRIGCSKLSLIAGVRGSLLYGESYLDTLDLLDDGRVFDRSDNYGALPIVESRIGLRYDNPEFFGSHLAVTTALEGQFWMNSGTGYVGASGRSTNAVGSSDERDADMGLVGGVLRVEYELPENFDRFDALLPPGTPTARSGPWISYENTFLQPHFSRSDAFQLVSGTGTVLETVGQQWDLEYAPRIEIGYQFEDCNIGVRGRYWSLDTNAGTTYTQPDFNENAHVGMLARHRIETTAPGDTLVTEHNTSMSAFELELINQRLGRHSRFSYGGGFRYSEIDHLFNAEVLSGAGNTSVSSSYAFQGFGPTLFGEVDHPIGGSKFSLVGGARASLLFGDSNYRLTSFDDRIYQHDYQTALLPVFESQFGIKYSACNLLPGNLSITAAVEGQYWMDSGTGYLGPHAELAAGSGAADARDADLGLIGGVIKVGYEF